ncbi:PSP1 superfamily protein [Syntrophotalea carbinolica DSM 2380]|uniref:PSP1 superfamily protein n=1 Tax=Syntrophotalea carbinolica (strain DSM 2380 / NBRC 103641 / GraBd1) TaxID=338963 RepID=Q3A3X1_SYNC1|nr:stage 0 sporulation family protein [Syntrophotalea carbinolica]ABA88936.1 PSP1 superfamily protein [Syntrophotalea carbinolica DSM 2380]
MTRIVSIKFRTAGKHYHFNAGDLELKSGQSVIVETDRGRALGTVVAPPKEVQKDKLPENLKNVLRTTSEEDIALAERSAAREKEAFRFCLERIKTRQMEMKLVRAEYLYDGSKIIFYFTADGRVDFRELVKDLAHYFHTRIEMRQIGVRDEAKLIGGIGICGRALCCCTFLTDFVPVSVKMAKEQGLALNPNKISGQCGRLLCCLNYEYKTYLSLKQRMPKCGRQVSVEGKEGEIVGQNVLDQTVTVKLEENQKIEVPLDKVQVSQGPAREKSGKDAPQAKPRSRGPQRPRRGAQKKESAATGKREEDKGKQPTQGKTASKRRGQKSAQRETPAQTEGTQSARKRPRRKSRSKNRPTKNTPPGDKQ